MKKIPQLHIDLQEDILKTRDFYLTLVQSTRQKPKIVDFFTRQKRTLEEVLNHHVEDNIKEIKRLESNFQRCISLLSAECSVDTTIIVGEMNDRLKNYLELKISYLNPQQELSKIKNPAARGFWAKYYNIRKDPVDLGSFRSYLTYDFKKNNPTAISDPRFMDALQELAACIDKDHNNKVDIFEYSIFTENEDIHQIFMNLTSKRGLYLKPPLLEPRSEPANSSLGRDSFFVSGMWTGYTTLRQEMETAIGVSTQLIFMPSKAIRGDGEDDFGREFVWRQGLFDGASETIYLEQEYAPNRVFVFHGKREGNLIAGEWVAKDREQIRGRFYLAFKSVDD
eukprot:TRINITY_DN4243_c0_g1_i1.p1 TRINITY_DN4243_c0_g1~~TRINITY_DN4243_c0_g1_i1.p1  ORF type:complete len:338 (-),score=60.24 TRINITY_DN4243_c0_g1_i1:23-1036(-)